MNEKLKRIRTYAKFVDMSKEMIRIRAAKGIIKSVVIDGTIFIELTDEEYEQYNKKYNE